MPDNTPRSNDPKPDPNCRDKTELEEKDLNEVTGGAPTVSDITITKHIDPASP